MDDWRLPRQATCAIMALAVIGFPITARGDTPPPPSNLHRTQDAGECAAHGGTGDCTKLSDPNFVVLVWDGESTASRYAVWRIHGKTDANIGDVQYVNDPTPSLPTFFSFTGVTPYACYAVSGVDNTGVASELSAPWCMPGTIANVVHGNPVGRLRSAERRGSDRPSGDKQRLRMSAAQRKLRLRRSSFGFQHRHGLSLERRGGRRKIHALSHRRSSSRLRRVEHRRIQWRDSNGNRHQQRARCLLCRHRKPQRMGERPERDGLPRNACKPVSGPYH